MTNIIEWGNLKSSNSNKSKSQIILLHSSRSSEEYLTSLKYRFDGSYNKIPNFFIDKDGKIIQLLKPEETSNVFNNKTIDKNSIIICLENLGWLKKEPLKNYHINWIGNIYKGKVYDKQWRDYFHWDPYPERQIDSTVFLCKKLIDEFKIEKRFVGHNTQVDGVEKFKGIVCRSNFNKENTDLSPSFNFDYFLKKIENE